MLPSPDSLLEAQVIPPLQRVRARIVRMGQSRVMTSLASSRKPAVPSAAFLSCGFLTRIGVLSAKRGRYLIASALDAQNSRTQKENYFEDSMQRQPRLSCLSCKSTGGVHSCTSGSVNRFTPPTPSHSGTHSLFSQSPHQSGFGRLAQADFARREIIHCGFYP